MEPKFTWKCQGCGIEDRDLSLSGMWAMPSYCQECTEELAASADKATAPLYCEWCGGNDHTDDWCPRSPERHPVTGE
jgi:hypothetical protein